MPTLYRNARMLHPTEAPDAFVVDGPTITWVGRGADAGVGAGREVVDLAGAYVTPAFVDAHVHLTDTGLGLVGIDLRPARSLAEALDLVAAAARRGRGRPILGGGWNEDDWPEHRPPSAAELDRAAYGGVVYLARVDIHSAVVSSALMAAVPGLAGHAGSDPDGWVHEPAHDLVRVAAFASLTAGQRRDAQRAALQRAAGHGIACVHEMAGPAISSADDLLALLAPDGEPRPEVIGYWGELLAVETARELGAVGAAGDLFCDGSLGSHTAALSAPYADRPGSTGHLHHDTAALVEHVLRCIDAGLQAGFHAIGDAAVDQVLTAFEQASDRLGRAAGAGHRVEHAEYTRDPARFAATGLVASMQPVFDTLWGGRGGMYARHLGPDRALALNRCGDLAAAGVPLAFGSDSPVTELGPWAAVRAAAQHADPAASLDPLAAFAAHTRGGWQAAGRPDPGTLVAGAPATFAVWDAGPLDPVTGLPDLGPGASLPTCRRTVRAGVAIFSR